ncbi:hypothetical protein FBUS_08875, partial [Fasciolopsis buskii]
EDPPTIRRVHRLLCTQLQRPHAQIRQGVLQLVANLTDPEFGRQCVDLGSQSSDELDYGGLVCKPLRELILRNLQDFSAHLIRIDADAPNLPRPIEIAHQAEQQFIELLLNWESDIAHGYLSSHSVSQSSSSSSPVGKTSQIQWTASAQARGQLNSLLQFLRCAGATTDRAALADLIRVRHVLRDLERKRAQTSARERALGEAAARKKRARISQCLRHIQESASHLEEILTILNSVLTLLVPDPFGEGSPDTRSAHDHNSSFADPMHSPINSDQLRLHGHILGTSSGMGLVSAEGPVEILLPGATMRAGRPHICVPVELNEDTEPLADTAREYARLARDKHRPRLVDWIQTLESAKPTDLPDVNASTNLTETSNRVRQWLTQVDQLTNFSKRSPRTESSEDTSDGSDFEEVTPLSPSFSVHQPEPIKPVELMNDKVAQIQSVQTTHPSTQRCSTDVESSHCSSKVPSKSSSTGVSNLAQELFDVVPTKSSVVWRANESAHRFWRPMDPEEHEAPTEYMGDAISLCAQPHQAETPTQSDSGLTNLPLPEQYLVDSEEDDAVNANQLACWAPLLLTFSSSKTLRLCPRRDSGGRCPIHGRIVPRDPVTGRPVNPFDREQLQAEVVAMRQAKLEANAKEMKRLNRKRYPGLVDLNARPTGPRHRLQTRVLSKRAIRKVAETMDASDQRDIDRRFSDNFHHAVQPR